MWLFAYLFCLFILYLYLTCILTNVQFAKNKYETSFSHKHCEANQSQVKGQCALNIFVQKILVKMFICSEKKDSSENLLNHTDSASHAKFCKITE